MEFLEMEIKIFQPSRLVHSISNDKIRSGAIDDHLTDDSGG